MPRAYPRANQAFASLGLALICWSQRAMAELVRDSMRSRVAGGDGDAAFGGEEGVVGVVGGVEEVLTVELAEDERHEDVAGGDGDLRVALLDGLEAGERAVVVEVVEVLVGLADLRGEVDGVGVGGWIVGVCVKAGAASRKARRKRLRVFARRFMVLLRSLGLLVVLESTYLLMQMIGSDAVDLILDAGIGRRPR